jgi:1,4-alpha-glucan branching enzyme
MTKLKGNGSVEFRFFRPEASRVNIAADFNGWNGSLSMEPTGDGWWVVTTSLRPGEYRFRYLADGAWYTDYAAHGVEFGPMGWNAVLVVPSDEQKATPIGRSEVFPAKRAVAGC